MDHAAGFDYDLPPELIAQEPPPRRRDSQLMLVRAAQNTTTIHRFTALPDLLQPGDLLVANDSRVLAARLLTRRVDTGGQVEILLLAPESGTAAPAGAWRALARPARRLRPALRLAVSDPVTARPTDSRLLIVASGEEGQVIVVSEAGEDLALVADRCGEVPLPPYIQRDRSAPDADAQRRRDRERYQTVFARADVQGAGSAAAPTAGLHFDSPLLDRLATRGIDLVTVTLHVGLGTFRPPTPTQIAAGRLHAEAFHLSARTGAAIGACRRRGGRVVAVGTTSLRVLETVRGLQLAADAPVGTRREFGGAPGGVDGEQPPVFAGHAERDAAGWSVRGITRLFIQPPARVEAADGLLTNFHLPGSSLLRLVAAMTGEEAWRAAYHEAIARRLRFFSYGDAMLILMPTGEEPA